MRSAAARVVDAIFGDVDAAQLDLFRRGFSLTFLAYMAFRFTDAREWLTDAGYHTPLGATQCGAPDPFPTLDGWMVVPFGALTFGSAGAMVLGRAPRIAALVATGCAVYAQGVDAVSSYSLNMIYIAVFAALSLAPDVRAGEAVGAPRRVQSGWLLRSLRVSLAVQYFTAGWCKIAHGDWLAADGILHGQLQGSYRTELAAWLLRHVPREGFAFAELATLAFELLAPFLFLSRRLLPIGIVVGIGFHAFIALTMAKLIYFSAQIVSFYLLFVTPDDLRGLRDRAGGLVDRARGVIPPAS